VFENQKNTTQRLYTKLGKSFQHITIKEYFSYSRKFDTLLKSAIFNLDSSPQGFFRAQKGSFQRFSDRGRGSFVFHFKAILQKVVKGGLGAYASVSKLIISSYFISSLLPVAS